jgi:hypothetical protein
MSEPLLQGATMYKLITGWFSRFFTGQPKRDIFRFFDGQQWRSIDPLAAYYIMVSHSECDAAHDLPALVRDDFQTPQEAWETVARVQTMIRDMFGLKPFEQGGLTHFEADDLLGEFLAYIDRVKKKRNRLPQSSRSTAPTSSDNSTTKQPADLSGKATESNAAAPLAS